MTTYASEEHLERWQREHKFPRIHDTIYRLVHDCARGRSFVDLAAGTGLLAQRISTLSITSDVVAIEPNLELIGRATRYGVQVPFWPLKVTQETLPRLRALLVQNSITVAIARRCLPEILGAGDWGPTLASTLADSGVRELFLQGRRQTARATHPLYSIEREIEALGAAVDVKAIVAECAYLWIGKGPA